MIRRYDLSGRRNFRTAQILEMGLVIENQNMVVDKNPLSQVML